MKKNEWKKTARRLRLIRVVTRVNRAAGIVRAVTAGLSLLMLPINVLTVIKMIPDR